MTFDEIQKTEQSNIMDTYARFSLAIAKGEGVYAYDESGNKYLDMGSGIGVNCLGYCDPDWAAAIAEQASTLSHCSNLYYNPTQIAMAEKLCSLTGYAKAFFGNSGAEAGEGAIKLARKYSNNKYGMQTGRNRIITLENSFHGRTITTLAATGQDSFHTDFAPFTPGFSYVPANDIEALKAACDGNVCAVMMEAVQGEGGVVALNADYVKQAAAFLKEKDILLIFDEVQTGVGRTGTFFGFEHFGIKPDIVTLAKGLGGGLPIGAFLCTAELSGVLGRGSHGSTFGGNPIVSAGALAVLKKIPTLYKQIEENGEYLRAELAKLPAVTEVRGMGLMIGASLKDGLDAKAVAAACIPKGLLVLTAKTAIRLLPPLIITKAQIDEGLAILKTVLEEFAL